LQGSWRRLERLRQKVSPEGTGFFRFPFRDYQEVFGCSTRKDGKLARASEAEKTLPVEIPEVLIQRLRETGLSTRRFLKVDGKAAIEKEWPDRLYEPEELTRVWSGNYGVAAGGGLVLIDGDKEPLASWLDARLPRTFRVLSPGHLKPHHYLKVVNGCVENLTLQWGVDEKGQPVNVGHVQASRKYLVGPGGIHPEGGVYTVIDDAPVATIAAEKLLEVMAPFTKERQDRVHEATAVEKKQANVALSILQVVSLAQLKKSGNEYYGPHPVHGSETGRNFWINPRENVWHCFRHGTGGGPLLWFAVKEGMIRCEDAGPGALRGDKFKQALQKAVEHGLIEERKTTASSAREGNVKREEGSTLGDFHLAVKGKKIFLIDKSGEAVWSKDLDKIDGRDAKKELREKTGIEESEIDRAAASLLFSLQQKGEDQETKKVEEGLKPVETTLPKEELQKRALELLRSRQLLFKVKETYDKGVVVDRYRFVLGEDDKKLLSYVISVSAETYWAQSLWVTGTSGFGKTNMVVVTLKLMPPGYAKTRSYLTGAGLRYGSQDYKILFIREFRQFAEQDIRLVSREDGAYTYEIAVKDPETNEWTTQIGEIPAKTIMTTSAERLPSAQMLRRCWLLSVDEAPELTKLINKRKSEYRAGKVEPASPDEIAIIQETMRLLQLGDVIIPYAELLVDTAPWDRTRLDYFLDTIAVIAWTHQYQRVKDSQGRIIATPADLYIAIRIAWTTLMQSLMQLPERLRKCWDILPNVNAQVGITTKGAAIELSISQSAARNYLNDLVNLGYAYVEKPSGSREKNYRKSQGFNGNVSNTQSTLSVCNWKEIASLTESALKNASSANVSSDKETPPGLFVCDPLNGKTLMLTSTVENETLPKELGKSPLFWKELDSNVSQMRHGDLRDEMFASAVPHDEKEQRKETVTPETSGIQAFLSLGDKIKIVYDKVRELAVDGMVSKIAVADALQDRIDRNEALRLLAKLEEEGKLAAKGPEWYVVVGV
jgi:hypothetical protein